MQKSILETNVFDTVVNFLHILAALITRKAFSKDEIYADISSKGKKIERNGREGNSEESKRSSSIKNSAKNC